MAAPIKYVEWTPDYHYGGTEPFGEYEEDELRKIAGFECAYYWYWAGVYEGGGELLLKVNDKWYLHDMSHCSCFGPLSHLHIITGYKDFDDLREHCSEAVLEEIDVLLRAAEKDMKDHAYTPT